MDIPFLTDQIRHLRLAMFQQTNAAKLLLGKQLSWALQARQIKQLAEAEFSVFSQFGDDGIIQYLIHHLSINERRFIEFGVENYNESNTRFLLENNNWLGLVMDGSEENIRYIRNTPNYWRHGLTALCSFVTAENINEVISTAGFSGEIGLLHIDIDGNDYWLWKALDCVNPVISVIEYNSLFGAERAITVPYRADFKRFEAHYNGLYAGSSLAALCQLAHEKGYDFVGCNSAGNNAYFVRKDRICSLTPLSCQQGYVQATFREHRNQNGQLTFTSGPEAINEIRGLPVLNIQTQQIEAF